MRNSSDQRDFAEDWELWHRDHERRRAGPHGFLSITAIHWLDDEPRRFDDVPGAWSAGADHVLVTLGTNEELFVDGVRIVGTHRFDRVDEDGVLLSFGDALVEVARRDGHFMVRPRHPSNPVRTSYAGTPAYRASMEWVVAGRFIPYDLPRSIAVGANIEGLEHVYESPGEIQFNLAGSDLRLIAFNGDAPNELFIVFTDETAGTTTYAACRFLRVRGLSSDGRVQIDFNHATNPPCAYTDFATCPLPPKENHLPVRVEAGEQLPKEAR